MFAHDKIRIGHDVNIISGDLGANGEHRTTENDDKSNRDQNDGDEDEEEDVDIDNNDYKKAAITLEKNSSTTTETILRAPSIHIGPQVTVGNVFTNNLKAHASARILGNIINTLDLPIVADQTVIPEFMPGIVDLIVGDRQVRHLSIGSWRRLIVRDHGQLILDGGDYYVEELVLERQAVLLLQSNTNIFIRNRLEIGQSSGVNHDTENRFLTIYFTGHQTVRVQSESCVRLHLLAPEARVVLGKNVNFTGRISAGNIDVGKGCLLNYSRFDGNDTTPTTPDAFMLFARRQLAVGEQSRIVDGRIGSNGRSESALEFRKNGFTDAVVFLYSDVIRLDAGAVIGHAYYNHLVKRSSAIVLDAHTPVVLPIVDILPTIPGFTVDADNLTIKKNTIQMLTPGNYRDLKIEKNCQIALAPGNYYLRGFAIDKECFIKFS